jgi:hypothetical protein
MNWVDEHDYTKRKRDIPKSPTTSRKEGRKMTETSPNQTATTERNQETKEQNTKELLSTTTGTATSSPKNRN